MVRSGCIGKAGFFTTDPKASRFFERATRVKHQESGNGFSYQNKNGLLDRIFLVFPLEKMSASKLCIS